jgi:hypothetical protein
MSWSRAFDDPIELPGGDRVLRTLREAGHYVTKLQAKPHWQTAAHELMMAAERGGILMLAEIDNRHEPSTKTAGIRPASAWQRR